MIEKIKNILNQYGSTNNYDLCKNIAFFTMVIDHIGYYFFTNCIYLRVIGRVSMLIFAILHGFNSNGKLKLNDKILKFALLTQFLVMILLNQILFPLNILFSFYISYYLVDYIDNVYKKNQLFFYFLLLLLPLTILLNYVFEYGLYFFFIVFCGKIFSKTEKDKKDKVSTIVIFLIYFIYQVQHFSFNLIYSCILFLLFALIYIIFYNFKIEKIGINNKILLFISRFSLELYFIHLLIFSLISNAYIR